MAKIKREYGSDLHIRLPIEVRTVLLYKAKENNQNITEYIINLILSRPIQYREVVERMDTLIDQVRRIGININQIAHHQNIGIISPEDIVQIRESQKQLEFAVLEIRKELMKPKV